MPSPPQNFFEQHFLAENGPHVLAYFGVSRRYHTNTHLRTLSPHFTPFHRITSPVNLLKQLCCDMGRSGVTVDDSIRCFGPFLLLLPLCSAKVGTGKTKHTTFIRNFSTNLFPRCVFLPSYVTINETPPHIVFVALSGPHRRITICTPDLPHFHPITHELQRLGVVATVFWS